MSKITICNGTYMEVSPDSISFQNDKQIQFRYIFILIASSFFLIVGLIVLYFVFLAFFKEENTAGVLLGFLIVASWPFFGYIGFQYRVTELFGRYACISRDFGSMYYSTKKGVKGQVLAPNSYIKIGYGRRSTHKTIPPYNYTGARVVIGVHEQFDWSISISLNHSFLVSGFFCPKWLILRPSLCFATKQDAIAMANTIESAFKEKLPDLKIINLCKE